jgi:outer membrane lipoprotein-sorting protein
MLRICGFVLALGWLAPAFAQPMPQMTVETVMAALASVSQRQGFFTEEKQLTALERPVVVTGTLIYRRPSYLEKHALAPRREDLVVDGNVLTVTDETGATRRLELGAQPEIRALVETIRATLAGDLAALERDFSVDSAGEIADWRLILRPTNPRLAGLVRLVQIEGSGPEPKRIETVMVNGDRTRLTIEPQR